VEPTVTDHLGSTPAIGVVVAGEEAGPEGDGLTAGDSFCFVVLFFLLFFHLPSVGTRTNCGTVFFFFFLTT
jgi:hypothetical protein